MNSTARRVPRITGLPARTSGSTAMRSESGIPTVYRANTRFGSASVRLELARSTLAFTVRRSSIGGEMVPHLKIEEAVGRILGGMACVTTGVPDPHRGERLALLYTDGAMAPRDLWQRLSETGLPALWIPKREDIFQVASLPLLGTGKLDLRAIKAQAASLVEKNQFEPPMNTDERR